MPGVWKKTLSYLGLVEDEEYDDVAEAEPAPVGDVTPTVGELIEAIKSSMGGRADNIDSVLEFDVDLRRMFSVDDLAINLGAEYGSMMVMSTLMTIPVVILFVFLQRFIVQGLTAGAIKG